jgi:hypothetical protein
MIGEYTCAVDDLCVSDAINFHHFIVINNNYCIKIRVNRVMWIILQFMDGNHGLILTPSFNMTLNYLGMYNFNIQKLTNSYIINTQVIRIQVFLRAAAPLTQLMASSG